MSAPSGSTLGPLDFPRGRDLVGRFAGLPIVIIGDLMMDQFIVGRVTRISPEAPVPVVEFDHDEFRIGGAANVAHNVRALGGSVDVIGVVGGDDEGIRLTSDLRAHDIGASGIVPDQGRRTTKKVRVVTTRNQQVARIDYESDGEVKGPVEAALIAAFERAARSARAIVVSDYLKGTVTHTLMRRAVGLAHETRVPLLVDPKIPHLEYYAGARLVTPNNHEAEVATHMRIRSNEEARAAAHAFRQRAACDSVLITRGESGMWLLDGSAEGHLPAATREVSDVTGAGDTVIATLALALAAGAAMAEAAALANHAAGVTVSKFGPATVTPEELLEALTRR